MTGANLRARFEVPIGHPMFPGHFPDLPVAPGAWLLGRAMEALEASAGGALEWGELESGKFHRAVPPGSTLDVGLEGACMSITQDDIAIATAKFRSVQLPAQEN